MLKTVTCALSTIKSAADKEGIKLTLACLPSEGNTIGSNLEADVVLRRVNSREVAVQGRTMQGDLFLSLLVAGAF